MIKSLYLNSKKFVKELEFATLKVKLESNTPIFILRLEELVKELNKGNYKVDEWFSKGSQESTVSNMHVVYPFEETLSSLYSYDLEYIFPNNVAIVLSIHFINDEYWYQLLLTDNNSDSWFVRARDVKIVSGGVISTLLTHLYQGLRAITNRKLVAAC